ncbi:jhy protein homolog [Hyla sarda]|uniref:jhy protein homolog n=1 Tax=Hyla sarda TaxID=327740 RepID=UPI0024C263FC|nr:jhy protein homolog [Hyla sarda]XP_056400035.1 jhy protein homolog [Hyla sarda]XP_056400036.1 jhy protein homolog [Hyla sarda]XP_056400038.1 jhy protein homolog [Hyla sarda]
MESDSAIRSLRGPAYGGDDVDLGLSSDSLEDSDTDSLCEERRYQSELQERLHSKYEIIIPTKGGTDGPQGKVTAGDTEDVSHQGKEEKRVGLQEIRTSYSELRYDPDWRKHQNRIHTSDQEGEEYLDVSSIDSPDEITLDPSGGRDSADDHPFWKPLTVLTSKNKNITEKPKSNGRSQIRKHGSHQNIADKTAQREADKTAQREADKMAQREADKKEGTAQHEASKIDIIEKNKATLGVRKEKNPSYLHIHKRKTEESKSGQNNEKSNVQPMEGESHLGKEIHLPEAIDKSGPPENHIHDNRPKTLNMAGALSDISASHWDTMAVYSEDYDNEYVTIPSYPDRYREALMAPVSSLEHLQVHSEGSYHQTIKPLEMTYGHYMETMEDFSIKTQPEAPGTSYNAYPDAFIAGHMIPPRYPPMGKSTRAKSESEACARNRSSNEKTGPCPSGERKTSQKYQKRVKSFLNQEVKLGGLGPVNSVSQEKKEQLKQQKEYAKAIQEQIRNKPVKPREIQVSHNDKNKSTRQKSLEYAKKVPRPQPLPKVSSETRADVPERRATSYDSLFPQMKLLEDLQIRHEREKMAVAALNALHIL